MPHDKKAREETAVAAAESEVLEGDGETSKDLLVLSAPGLKEHISLKPALFGGIPPCQALKVAFASPSDVCGALKNKDQVRFSASAHQRFIASLLQCFSVSAHQRFVASLLQCFSASALHCFVASLHQRFVASSSGKGYYLITVVLLCSCSVSGNLFVVGCSCLASI
jgi:hypothetical protein